MSLVSRKGLLERVRRDKASRTRLVSNNLTEGIAFQIAATRDKKGWSQADLARETGMSQGNISRLESPGYGRHTLTSLKRIAEALDVALMVRFVPFSQFVDWLSGTARLDLGLNPESLAVASFEHEEAVGAFSARGVTLETQALGGIVRISPRQTDTWHQNFMQPYPIKVTPIPPFSYPAYSQKELSSYGT